MKYLVFFGLIACAALADAMMVNQNCGGALPMDVCARLKSLQGMVLNLANRSISTMAKAVQQSAERNAKLFANTMAIINKARVTRPVDPVKLARIMQDMQMLLIKAEKARSVAIQMAIKSIQEATMKIIALIQKLIADAVSGTRTDLATMRMQLQRALNSSHTEIRRVTFEAVSKVMQGTKIVEEKVVRILAMLGYSQVSMAQSFVEAMSIEENMKIADDSENELESDFDAAANEAYKLIALRDKGISKRSVLNQWYWGRIVVWYQQLPIMMAAAIQRQLVAIQLHAQHNLHVILQIIIHTARQAITNICKNMTVIVTVTPPPS